ncbi:MAG: AsmA-like C-terminal region-containing protein [Alistipes sp.]
MKKFFKITTLVLVVLLAVAILVPIALRGRVDEIVKREANKALVARLDFEKLNISLLRHFPHASLDLKGLTLVGVDRFAGDTLIAADRVSVVVDVMSLFGDEGFEVSKVILAHPTIRAHKLADGSVNWDVMKPETPDSVATDATPSAFHLSVRDVRVTDASLRYVDDSTRMRVSAAPASLRLKGDMTALQTDLTLRAKTSNVRVVSAGMTLLTGADAALDAVVSADLLNKKFTFSKNTLRLNAITLSLDGWVDLSEADAMAMDITAGCEKVQFKDILSMIPAFYTKDFNNLTATGEISLSAWVKGKLRGSKLPAFEVTLGVREGSFRFPALPKAVTGIHIAARAASQGGTFDNATLEVSTLAMTMAGNSLSASFAASHPMTDLHFAAAVTGKVDLGAIREVYPLDKDMILSGLVTADVKAKGKLSDIDSQRYETIHASGTFVVERMSAHFGTLPEIYIRRAAATITPMAMTLGDFGATIGRSDLTANGQLTGYLGYLLHDTPLAGRLYVKSNLLDMNEMMAVGNPADTTATDTTALSVVVVPRNLNLSVSADLHEVKFQKMVLTDFAGELQTTDGTLSLNRLSMKAFGGSMLASGSYSTAANPQRPNLNLALDIAHASFVRTFEELEMIQKMVPLFQKTGGDYSMTLDLSTALNAAMSPELMTLNAQGELRSNNIHIQQIEAFSKLADLLRNDKLKTIEAKDVTIRFSVANGRMTTLPFDLKMGNIAINLAGSTGLDQTIDYTARVSLPSGVAGGMLPAINVGMGGTFSAPKITLGAKEAVTEVVTKLLNDQVQKLTGSATVKEVVAKQKEKLTAEVARQAAKLRDEAQRAGERLVAAAEVQRTKLVDGAKSSIAKKIAAKAGDKLVAEAQHHAAQLMTDTEARIAQLTAEQK